MSTFSDFCTFWSYSTLSFFIFIFSKSRPLNQNYQILKNNWITWVLLKVSFMFVKLKGIFPELWIFRDLAKGHFFGTEEAIFQQIKKFFLYLISEFFILFVIFAIMWANKCVFSLVIFFFWKKYNFEVYFFPNLISKVSFNTFI